VKLERVTSATFLGFVPNRLSRTLETGELGLRRLFSTFARGWPGTGLLLLRVIAGIALIFQSLMRLAALDFFAVAAGALLIFGFWTPVGALLTALVGIWNSYTHFGDPWANVLLAGIGVSLAMVGPGAWSVDGWLFGWKRIDVGDGEG
jgi:putative oxidoreductase